MTLLLRAPNLDSNSSIFAESWLSLFSLRSVELVFFIVYFLMFKTKGGFYVSLIQPFSQLFFQLFLKAPTLLGFTEQFFFLLGFLYDLG